MTSAAQSATPMPNGPESHRDNAVDVESSPRDQYFARFTDERIQHWNDVAAVDSIFGRAYKKLTHRAFAQIVAANSRVLEIGCGHGDLLAALNTSRSVGVDFSPTRIEEARRRHPDIDFIVADGHELPEIDEEFDYVILSDLVNDAFDVLQILEQTRRFMTHQTRLVVTFRSHLWSLPINIARRFGLVTSGNDDNWLTPTDMENMLSLSDIEVVRNWNEIILPIDIPVVGDFINRYLPKIWPLSHLSLTHFYVGRSQPQKLVVESLPSVSVVVPARNEAGHIRHILDRVPKMGSATEIVFVEGGSSDDTLETIERELEQFDRLPARLYQQTGKGKGDATRMGFAEARNDVLMILDADITVMPEDLPKFYRALTSGAGELVNGVRLVYPMEKQAMRPLNFLGNKFFSVSFSWLLGQPIKDTLCGTKVLYRSDWDKIVANRDYFGDFDPFGDFDIIFGAAKQNMKIVDLPVRYRERQYGETNINRWEGGYLLLRMLMVAFRKLKFC